MAKGRKTGGKLPIKRTETHKECAQCHMMQPLSYFHKDKSQRSGLSCSCRKCRGTYSKDTYASTDLVKKKAADKRYYQKNPLKVRDRFLKTTYGIDLNRFNEMFNEQNGSCAICKRHQSQLKKTLAVDHCHETGKVRALLCGNCNTTLGRCWDREDILQECLNYLRRYKS